MLNIDFYFSKKKYVMYGLSSSIIQSLVLPYLTIYLVRYLNFSSIESSQLIGIAIAINFFLKLYFAPIIDRIPKYNSLLIGSFFSLILPITLVLSKDFYYIIISLIFFYLGSLIVNSTVSSFIYSEDKDKNKNNINYSLYYASSNILFFLTPFILNYLINFNYLILFKIAIISQTIVSLFFLINAYKLRDRDKKKIKEKKVKIYRLKIFLNRGFFVIFLIGFLYSLLYAQYFTNISNILGAKLYPMIVSVNGILSILSQPFYVYFIKTFKEKDCLLVGCLLLLCSFIFIFFNEYILMVLIFSVLFSISETFINLSIMENLMSYCENNERAAWINLFSLSRISNSIGIIIGGYLLGESGLFYFMGFMILTSIVMIFACYLNIKYKKTIYH